MTFVKELEKVLKPQNIIILLGILVVGMALCHYTDQKNSTVSGFTTESSTPTTSENTQSNKSVTQSSPPVKPNSSMSSGGAPLSAETSSSNFISPPSCNAVPTLNPSELLPQGNGEWAALQTPSGTPEAEGGGAINFLSSDQLVGINTVGSSLRNANLQVRSEPPNPQMKVGPWNQSTIEPDVFRQPFEIGCGCPGSSEL